MVYPNTSRDAILAMEKDRTGCYGDIEDSEICGYCCECEEAICYGEDFYNFDGDMICRDCAPSYWFDNYSDEYKTTRSCEDDRD